MCTKPTWGHNLAFFYTGSFARTTRPNESLNELRPNELRPNDLFERFDTDALKRPDRKLLRGCTHNRNKPTRESWANELHEHSQSQPRVTT